MKLCKQGKHIEKKKEVKAGAERAKVFLSRRSTQSIIPSCQAKQNGSGKRIMRMRVSLGRVFTVL